MSARRGELGSFDGEARSVYIVGRLFGEPHDELLDRVREIRDAERARLRAEISGGPGGGVKR